MNGPVLSSVAVTANELAQLSERAAHAAICDWPDRCHCCEISPTTAGGVLCSGCRAEQERESERVMTETETIRTETWTYVGQRVDRQNKAFGAWLPDDGADERWFGKVKGTQPGARYEVTIRTNDDGTESVFSSGERGPRYIGMNDSEDERLGWAMAERAALTALEQHRLAKRATNELHEQCAALREQYGQTIGHARRAALLAAIIEEITS